MVITPLEYKVHLCSTKEHPIQDRFVESTKKRIVIKAGRRGGKTKGIAKRAVKRFLKGRRQLYAAPTNTQTDAFWFEVCKALREPIDAGIFKKDETEQFIELTGTKQRIKAKTAWNANTLRGDFADDLYLDEFQLMNEDAWSDVGQPMLLDNNGDAVFAFTPPSLKSEGVSKAKDPRHASKLYQRALTDKTGNWEAVHFTSHDNPFISKDALDIITVDMSLDSYRREIMAEDDEIERSWLVHSNFNETICKIQRFEIPASWDVSSGHDFGSANPAALFVAEAKTPLPPGAPPYMRRGDLVIFREYAPGAGRSIIQHVDTFKELTKGYTVVRRAGGNRTTEDETRQGYAAYGWPIIVPLLDKVKAQVDRVISLEESNRIYVFSDLVFLLSQISNCLWLLDKDNKPTNEIANEKSYHLLAALRYLMTFFNVEAVNSGLRSRQTSIY
ncbi:MAG: hypothetical protein PHV11_08070 [Candidatus Bipolaricaulis sp.]|nr:hypothetical protein [Candidatus Bipolaricaulis sp.]